MAECGALDRYGGCALSEVRETDGYLFRYCAAGSHLGEESMLACKAPTSQLPQAESAVVHWLSSVGEVSRSRASSQSIWPHKTNGEVSLHYWRGPFVPRNSRRCLYSSRAPGSRADTRCISSISSIAALYRLRRQVYQLVPASRPPTTQPHVNAAFGALPENRRKVPRARPPPAPSASDDFRHGAR